MRCSVQDIARELSISRNTVSKALNGRPGVSNETRKLICEKANEMNYRTFLSEQEEATATPGRGSILLLTKATVHSEFWLSVMKGMETVLQKSGYTLLLGLMSNEDMRDGRLPPQLYSQEVKGVILVEICDSQLCRRVLEIGLPAVSVDAPRNYERLAEEMDIVTMENKSHIRQTVRELVQRGRCNIAFAGDLESPNVGEGFQERYEAVCEALTEEGLKLDQKRSLTCETNQQFMNLSYLIQRFQRMEQLPDAYVCGNDWTALQIMHALQYCGYMIPRDVSVLGFDNIAEAASAVPALSTIDTPKEVLGQAAANCVLQRLSDPQRPYVFIRYATRMITRDSL